MAVSVDWASKLITIPRSDLTFIGGSLYELDTDWLRLQLKDLEDDEAGIPWPDTHRHNTEVTVAGVTYARFIEIINGYQVMFDPDEAYTVRLAGSNNNLFEQGVLVLGNYSVISQNAAGLIVSGNVTPAAVWQREVELGFSAEELLRLIASASAGKLSGAASTTVVIRDVADQKDRITATVDDDGNRTAVALDVA